MFLHLIFTLLFGMSNTPVGTPSLQTNGNNFNFSQRSQQSTAVPAETGSGTGGEVGQNPPPKID